MSKLRLFLLKVLFFLHNYLTHKISNIVNKLNNGIHPKHEVTNYHEFFIQNLENTSKVLDLGCGIGALSYDLAKKAQYVVACDIDKKSINTAKNRFNSDNIKYITADATQYDFNEIFDYIILSNILEHIKDRNGFLNKIKHFGKTILIRVPMLNRSWLPMYKKSLGLDYRLDPTHYIEYTYETFKKEMDLVGLKIISYSIQFGEIWAKVGNV